ncbi:hypothetical protein TNIN_362341 [Trichonephila inaurata madagascariensis]|uniref:Uncharacterized protein n=1 Tax=Trichonephila inaurata madagascariensis TaxID=2747483 RepID=A0A8X6XLI7_9ARAC|nr:hypothetical protein TNIN_362341 [Trichonephila inaurata madagascariensis]
MFIVVLPSSGQREVIVYHSIYPPNILDQIAKDAIKAGEVKFINAYGNPDKFMYIAVHYEKKFILLKAAMRAEKLHYHTVFEQKFLHIVLGSSRDMEVY